MNMKVEINNQLIDVYREGLINAVTEYKLLDKHYARQQEEER